MTTVRELGEDAFVAAVVGRLAAVAAVGGVAGADGIAGVEGGGVVARGDGADGAEGGSATAWRVLLGPGDDAAVLTVAGPVVLSTDTLVQDVDFRLDWSTGHDVGVKAAVQALSDVAAMGALPVALLVALAVPGDADVAWCLDLADGLAEECARAGASVVGGDVADAGQIVVTGTAVGVLPAGVAAVARSGARPGDIVALAGSTGASAAGLALLLAGRPDLGADAAQRHVLGVHRAPTVQHGAGSVARIGGATALIDVSDGLVRDATRIARASGVVIDLDPAALQPSRELLAVAHLLGADAHGWVLTSGEEHAMLGCFPPRGVLPAGYRAIGRVRAVPADGAAGVRVAGVPYEGTGGWTHYDRRP